MEIHRAQAEHKPTDRDGVRGTSRKRQCEQGKGASAAADRWRCLGVLHIIQGSGPKRREGG